MASNERITVNDELEGVWKEAVSHETGTFRGFTKLFWFAEFRTS
jgi:hypothetical protein